MKRHGKSPTYPKLKEGYADDGDVIRPHYKIKMKDGKLRTLKDIDREIEAKKTQKNSYEPEGEIVDEGQKCWKGYEKKRYQKNVW